MCLEGGTLSGWLHEVLEPHVEELVVAGVRESRGPKSDKRDAFALAEQFRIGALETRVYKSRGQFRRLGQQDRAGIERLVRYCARPPSIVTAATASWPRTPGCDPTSWPSAGPSACPRRLRPKRLPPHPTHPRTPPPLLPPPGEIRWAVLLARIYDVRMLRPGVNATSASSTIARENLMVLPP